MHNKIMSIQEKRIADYFLADKSVRILDWGCGDGTEIDNFKRQGYLNILGLDVDPLYDRNDVIIECDSVGYLEKNPQTYDVIFARQSIYYIPKDGQSRLWNSFHAALKPNGKLIVIVFNGALTSAEWIIQKDFGIQFSLNEVSLRNLANLAGFRNLEILGIKVPDRTPIGSISSAFLNFYRTVNSQLRYISERGFDGQNPKIFTKSLVILANK